MKGMITRAGFLAINGKVRECPFKTPPELARNCGDWCALFGETEDVPKTAGFVWLELCHKTIEFDDFTDERI
jgi:hypothetical protein